MKFRNFLPNFVSGSWKALDHWIIRASVLFVPAALTLALRFGKKDLLQNPPGDWLTVLSILAGFSINMLILVLSMAGAKKREILTIRPGPSERGLNMDDSARKASLAKELLVMQGIGSHTALTLAMQLLLVALLVANKAKIFLPVVDIGYAVPFHFILFCMGFIVALQVGRIHALIGS